uniref:Uncharacterized protein n=1 Tax=Anguilla anguilla TaxID=7936 RepID=A0A0E9QZP9_ANGAN
MLVPPASLHRPHLLHSFSTAHFHLISVFISLF